MKGEKYVFIKEHIVAFIRVETIHDWNYCTVASQCIQSNSAKSDWGKLSDSIDLVARNIVLIMELTVIVLSAAAMYGLRFVWRLFIWDQVNSLLGQRLRNQLYEHFYKHVSELTAHVSAT